LTTTVFAASAFCFRPLVVPFFLPNSTTSGDPTDDKDELESRIEPLRRKEEVEDVEDPEEDPCRTLLLSSSEEDDVDEVDLLGRFFACSCNTSSSEDSEEDVEDPEILDRFILSC